MILSVHAKERMLSKNISEDEVLQCLDFGVLKATNCVEGEIRHYKRLDLKEKSVVVIYTFENDELRVITVYAIINKWKK
ncbi:MAG: DUF4258 domain-containing protein [Candidatus Woesearchaeota archaeon]|nr:DUF4258 domain-containing protein [Candidatus Woesearchaeota archaeon]